MYMYMQTKKVDYNIQIVFLEFEVWVAVIQIRNIL